MSETSLAFVDVSFAYKDSSPVVTDLAFEIRRGERIALYGASGCGKTTILNLAADILKPTSGQVVRPEANREIGVAYQKDALFPWRTVSENLRIGAGESTPPEFFDEPLAAVGLSPSIKNSYPSELSVGMRKRIDVVRLGLQRPSLVLLDEPFAPLDKRSTEATRNWLFNMIKSSALLLVSHDLIDVCEYVDRILVFPTGEGNIALLDNEARELSASDPKAVKFRVRIAQQAGVL